MAISMHTEAPGEMPEVSWLRKHLERWPDVESSWRHNTFWIPIVQSPVSLFYAFIPGNRVERIPVLVIGLLIKNNENSEQEKVHSVFLFNFI